MTTSSWLASVPGVLFGVCTVLLGIGPAQAGGTSPTEPLSQLVALRRQHAVELQKAEGARHLQRGAPAQAARSLAVAAAYDAQPAAFLAVARACRRADLDVEAAAIYKHLADAPLPKSQRSEIEEELRVLAAKVEDLDSGITPAMREHLDGAKRLFQGGHFSAAAEEYALAFTLKPLPRLLFNTAQAYRRAGRMEQAYILYSQFLLAEPQSPLRTETNSYLNELRSVAFYTPLQKRPWFWAVVGTAAASLAATAVGLGVGLRPQDPYTSSGTYSVRFGSTR